MQQVEPAPAVAPETIDDGEAMDRIDPFIKFASSQYDYCDAKVLSALWGEDTSTAKSSIGRFLLNGEAALLDEKLSGAQQRAVADMDNREIRCHYDEIGYDYEDAVVLAKYWNIDPWEAKMRIEEKFLRDGHERTFIDAALWDAG